MTDLSAALLCLAAFVLGAVPFGFLAGRLQNKDIRQLGSGNIGATNVYRYLGIGPAIVVFLLDVLKGLAPVLAAQHLFPSSSWWAMGAGLAALLGHTYSPFLGFKGGKGVATSLGVLIGLSPLVAGLSLSVFIIAVALTRYVSLGSVLAAATEAILIVTLSNPLSSRLLGLLAAFFVIYKHRANIVRLRAGTENKIGKK